jgi:hypothetical protein
MSAVEDEVAFRFNDLARYLAQVSWWWRWLHPILFAEIRATKDTLGDVLNLGAGSPETGD